MRRASMSSSGWRSTLAISAEGAQTTAGTIMGDACASRRRIALRARSGIADIARIFLPVEVLRYGSVFGARMSCQVASGSSAPDWFTAQLVGQPVQSLRCQGWPRRRPMRQDAAHQFPGICIVARLVGSAAFPWHSDRLLSLTSAAPCALTLGAGKRMLEADGHALRRAASWHAVTAVGGTRGTAWGNTRGTLCIHRQRTIRPATSYPGCEQDGFANGWLGSSAATPRMEAT